MNSAYIALLYRVSELARRYGLRPSEAEAAIDFVHLDPNGQINPEGNIAQYRLSFDLDPPDDPEKAGRFLKMKAALGCEGDHIDSTFLSDMEDIVDRAISLAPKLRSL
jgi:hypothetical protein